VFQVSPSAQEIERITWSLSHSGTFAGEYYTLVAFPDREPRMYIVNPTVIRHITESSILLKANTVTESLKFIGISYYIILYNVQLDHGNMARKHFPLP